MSWGRLRAGDVPGRRFRRAASLRGCQPEAGRLQPAKQLAALDHHGTTIDQQITVLLGHVVVVALEAASRNVVGGSERVEFVE